jgi:hypothetical protein
MGRKATWLARTGHLGLSCHESAPQFRAMPFGVNLGSLNPVDQLARLLRRCRHSLLRGRVEVHLGGLP